MTKSVKDDKLLLSFAFHMMAEKDHRFVADDM